MTPIETAMIPLPTIQVGSRGVRDMNDVRSVGGQDEDRFDLAEPMVAAEEEAVSRRSLLLVRAWPWLLALLVLAPVLGPGYVLSYDMVAVPDLALRPDFLGLGSSLPRAVSRRTPWWPSSTSWSPAPCCRRRCWSPRSSLRAQGRVGWRRAQDPLAQLVATTVYVWSPLVAERLVIGHWPLLVTYAVLPWIVVASRRVRSGDSGPAPVVLLVAAGSLSAAGGVLVTLFAVICVAGRAGGSGRPCWSSSPPRAVNAPWWVAGLLQSAAAVSDPGVWPSSPRGVRAGCRSG